MNALLQNRIDNDAASIASGTSPSGDGTPRDIGSSVNPSDVGGQAEEQHDNGTQSRIIADSSDSDDAVMAREVAPVPMPDWDIVDAASLDSFPASDPPSWWAGGSGRRLA